SVGYNFPNLIDDLWFKLRLKLKNIYRLGTDNTTTQLYCSFDYNETVALPERLSPSQDAYGFYNAHSPSSLTTSSGSFTFGVPAHLYQSHVNGTNTTKTYGVNKNNSATHAYANSLKKITNSAGGFIEFTTKSHSLSNFNYTFYPFQHPDWIGIN